MRVFHAAALTVAALLLASIGSAQGIGGAAARERERRKATPEKPAKVYTEGDLGPTMPAPAPVEPAPAPAPAAPAADPSGTPATDASGAPPADAPASEATGATPAEGTAEGAAPDPAKAEAEAAQAAAAQQAKEQETWRRQLDNARQREKVYREAVDTVQTDLNDVTGGYVGPGRASKIAFLEESKQKLAAVQAEIATLEADGRRKGYR